MDSAQAERKSQQVTHGLAPQEYVWDEILDQAGSDEYVIDLDSSCWQDGSATLRDPPSGGRLEDKLVEPLVLPGKGYLVDEFLDSGGSARVYALKDETGRSVDKVVKLQRDGAASRRECELMKSLCHPNVLPLEDSGTLETLPDMNYLVLPRASASLDEWVFRSNYDHEDVCKLYALFQMGKALKYLHKVGLVHRDVKPDNTLLLCDQLLSLVEPASCHVALSDFGLVAVSQDAQEDDSLWGTPAYLAPEYIADPDAPLSPTFDMYAFGVTYTELLTGAHPFEGQLLVTKLLRSTMREEPLPLKEVRPDLPDDVCQLGDCLLTKDPSKRPTASQAVASIGDMLKNGYGFDAQGVWSRSLIR